MEAYENHLSLAIALAVGLLIGLEREQIKRVKVQEKEAEGLHPGGASLGGIRTYPLFALVGALSTMLGPASMWLPLVSLLGVFALVSISYAADVRRSKDGDDHGVTTEASIIATYLLGALAASKGVVEPMADRLVLVAGLGVAITFLLSSKELFHGLASRVSRDDLFATTKFLIVAVIVLPLLPDKNMGPFEAINPRKLGLLVVTISGLSFAGYVAMKLWGAKRGMLLGAALGGLVSSTAVTLSFATRTKDEPRLAPVSAGAIAVAWTIMLVRVGVVVAIIDLELLATLSIPLGAMVLGALVGLVLTFRRQEDGHDGKLDLKNPFELGSAIKVSLMFGVVLLITKGAIVYLGSRGLYLASALGGTTDVDAVTLSSAQLAATDTVTAIVATVSIAIAIAVNTLVKTGMAAFIGGSGLGRRVTLVAVVTLVAGGAALAATAGFG
jgi:uncharacterized membrane protein (DUF4010 family)